MTHSIPKLSLAVLICPSGSGQTTFARTHFLPAEILSSDSCRALDLKPTGPKVAK